MRSTKYLRHRQGEERRTPPGSFEPLRYEDDLIGQTCPECGHVLRAGDYITEFRVGPATLADALEADARREYDALVIPFHEGCAWQDAPVALRCVDEAARNVDA